MIMNLERKTVCGAIKGLPSKGKIDFHRVRIVPGEMMKIGGGLTQNAVVLGKPSELE